MLAKGRGDLAGDGRGGAEGGGGGGRSDGGEAARMIVPGNTLCGSRVFPRESKLG